LKTIAIVMRDSNRIPRLKEHLEENGISDCSLFYGFDGEKSGLVPTIPHQLDDSDIKSVMHPKVMGCFMSHLMLWKSLNFDTNTPDSVHIFEDDVVLKSGWKETVDNAIAKLPEDWDILFAGSCCASDKLGKQHDSNLFEGFPLCTHYYVVRKKALKTLIESNEEVCQPIDIQMYYRTSPTLKSFIIFPRVADQWDIEIPD
jgi:GR25 family glycosyltransferase involved in LPS biosynthesis